MRALHVEHITPIESAAQKRTSRQQVVVGAFQPPLFEMIVKASTPMK